MCHVLVFFLKYQPQREGVAENATITYVRENKIKSMYSDCRGRFQHKGSFCFVQNAEKLVQVACFFFSHQTSSAENKATVYLIFLPTCLQELTRGHHLIFIHSTLPLT